jgi:TonB family protein
VKKYPLLLLLLCTSAALRAQTDTVATKISKVPYVKVDVLAKFPGGDFAKYIAANIVYKKKLDKNIHGQVILSMKIDSNGHVSNVNILKSMSPDIDQGITRAVRSSPKWKPALNNGKNVATYMVFNIDMGILGAATAAKEKKDNITILNKKVAPPPVIKNTVPPVTETKTVPKPVKVTPTVRDKNKLSPVVVKKAAPVVTKPVLKAIRKQMPPFDKKPLPVVEKKPAARVVKKVEKPIQKKAIFLPVPKRKTPKLITKPVPQVVKLTPAVKAHAFATKKTKTVNTKSDKKDVDENGLPLGRSAEAEFPGGGMQAFYQYLSRNVRYPIVSKINKIEGEVNLTFIIDTNGAVTDVKVTDAPAEDLAQEAVRVLTASPRWKPAMQNGVLIKRSFSVPINFKLQDKPKQP